MAVAAPLAETPEVTLEPAEHFAAAPVDHEAAEPVDLDLDEHAVPPESSKSLRAVPEVPAAEASEATLATPEPAPIDLDLDAAPIEVSLGDVEPAAEPAGVEPAALAAFEPSAADALLADAVPMVEPAVGEVSQVQDVVAAHPQEAQPIELSLDAGPELQLQPVADAVADAAEPPVVDLGAIEVAAPEEAAIEAAPIDEPTFVDGHIPDAPPTPLEGSALPRFESPPQTPKRVAPAFVVPEPAAAEPAAEPDQVAASAHDDASPDTLAPAAAAVVAKVATAVALVGAPQGRFEPVAVTIEAAVVRPEVTPADVAAFVGAVRGARPTTFGDVLDAALDL